MPGHTQVGLSMEQIKILAKEKDPSDLHKQGERRRRKKTKPEEMRRMSMANVEAEAASDRLGEDFSRYNDVEYGICLDDYQLTLC